MANRDDQIQAARFDRRTWARRAVWAAFIMLALWLVYILASALLTFATLPAEGFEPGQPSIVYAADGSEVGPLTGDVYRIPVDFAEMPAYLPQAFVAAEDIRFYEHHGVDPRGIARALLANLRAGGIAEGGSTITQQVVKNTFLTQRQSVTRKLQEAILALLMERRYEKDEILGLYLNQLYMGHGTYGVGAAARLYFNKDAADLTLSEAATLAGITPSPEGFSPLRDPAAAEERRDLVLERMVAAGYLTPEQAAAEEADPVAVSQGELDLDNPYPWYMEEVRQELSSRYGLDEQVVALMGLKVYTGLDPTMQRTAEQRLAARIFPANTPDGVEAAFAAVDPRTGEVRALVGGREYPVGGGLNRASDGRISPGSVLKPVIVYGPAIEREGLTPDSVVKDEPLNLDGWQPENWDFQFRGEVTLREAARLSLNIPSINLMQEVGVEKARQFAANLGIPLTSDDDGLTLALGAMSKGLSPLELVGAYQPFANGGTYHQPHLITKVEASDGLIKGRRLTERKAMRPQTAYTVTDLLQTVVEQGTGTGALIGRPMAGKTGTVELPPAFEGQKGNSAAWFVGYTPDVVASVWVGYDQIDAEHYLPPEVNGSTYPTWLWRQVVGAALSDEPVLAFPDPDGRPQAAAQPAPEPAQPPEPAKPVLPAITALTAAPGPQPGSVNLTWQAQGGNVEAANLGFKIVRNTTADAPVDDAHTIATASGSPYLDVLTKPGTYYYRVVAVDKQTGAVGEPSAALPVKVELEPDGGKNPGDKDDEDPGTSPDGKNPDDESPDGSGPNDLDPGDDEPGGGEPGVDEPESGQPGDDEPSGAEQDGDDGGPGDLEPADGELEGAGPNEQTPGGTPPKKPS